MKCSWVLAAVLLLWSSLGFAQTYRYEPAVITLQGTLLMAPGETADGKKLSFPALKLSAPITVNGTRETPTEGNLDLLHVVLNETTSPMFKGLNGKNVAVTGTLIHSDNANHQTRVLIVPSQIVANSGDTPPSAAKALDASRPVKALDEYTVLIDRARSYVIEWNRADPLCDQIESPGLESIQRGRIVFIASGGGKVDPPIPAIVARISGICVISSLRKREPITKFWMIIAHDKAFERYTCVKVGGAELIRGFVERNCEFSPNAGENGLIK